MFFAQDILCRRNGSLGVVWLFATCNPDGLKAGPRVTRREILSLDLQKACKDVQFPQRPFALRLSSQLLTGLTRVYNKQVGFLWDDVRQVWVQVQRQAEKAQKTNQLTLDVPAARYDAVTHTDFGDDMVLDDPMAANILELLGENMIELFSLPDNYTESFTQSVDGAEKGSKGRKKTQQADLFLLQEDELGRAEMHIDLNDNDVTFGDKPFNMNDITLEDDKDPTADLNQDQGFNGDVPFDATDLNFDLPEEQRPEDQPDPQQHNQEAPVSPVIQLSEGLPEMVVPAQVPGTARRKKRAGPLGFRKGPKIDAATQIDSQTLHNNLANTDDIVTYRPPVVGPKGPKSTARGSIRDMFTAPADDCISHPLLLEIYRSRCVVEVVHNINEIWQDHTKDDGMDKDAWAGDIPRGHDEAQEQPPFEFEIPMDGMVPGDDPQGLLGPHILQDGDMGVEVEKPRAGSHSRDTSYVASSVNISMPWTATPSTSTAAEAKGSVVRKASEVPSLDTPVAKKARTSRRASILSLVQQPLQTILDTSIGNLADLDMPQFDVPVPNLDRMEEDTAIMEETRDFYSYLSKHQTADGSVSFSSIAPPREPRIVAARALFQVLVLASTNYLRVQQDEPYDDIRITFGTGPKRTR